MNNNSSSTRKSGVSREVISFQSGENTTGFSRTFSKAKESELQKKIKKLQKQSNSYMLLVYALVFANVFKGLGGVANQKFIQSILEGEATDLATVDLFSKLTSVISPVFGYLMDNFYPFRYRIGPYLVFASLVSSLSLATVWAFPQSQRSFITAVTINACSLAFVDVITQGVIVMKTKMDVELFDLNEELKEMAELPREEGRRRLSHTDGSLPERMAERDRIGIRLFTAYAIYLGISGGIFKILSGVIVDNIPIRNVYLLQASPGVLVTFFVLFLLKEAKEKKEIILRLPRPPPDDQKLHQGLLLAADPPPNDPQGYHKNHPRRSGGHQVHPHQPRRVDLHSARRSRRSLFHRRHGFHPAHQLPPKIYHVRVPVFDRDPLDSLQSALRDPSDVYRDPSLFLHDLLLHPESFLKLF